jgi:hypothetical protein
MRRREEVQDAVSYEETALDTDRITTRSGGFATVQLYTSRRVETLLYQSGFDHGVCT